MNLQNSQFIKSGASAADFPRDALGQIVFAGRSNCGKSSAINRLLNRKSLARTSSAPGKTAFINFYNIDGKAYFVDLPGYGYARVSLEEKRRWGQLIDSYFDTQQEIALAVLIVDIRHEPTMDDRNMAEYFFSRGIEFIVLAGKADKLKTREIAPGVERIKAILGHDDCVKVIPFSSISGLGKNEVIAEIFSYLGVKQ